MHKLTGVNKSKCCEKSWFYMQISYPLWSPYEVGFTDPSKLKQFKVGCFQYVHKRNQWMENTLQTMNMVTIWKCFLLLDTFRNSTMHKLKLLYQWYCSYNVNVWYILLKGHCWFYNVEQLWQFIMVIEPYWEDVSVCATFYYKDIADFIM